MTNWLKRTHQYINRLPFSSFWMVFFIKRFVPYSGTISPTLLELKPGLVKIQIKDRGNLRNHLNSLHAVALMNLAELASGLVFNYDLPDQAKSILVEFNMEFIKKARGTITATSAFSFKNPLEEKQYEVWVELHDAHQNLVAKAKASWRVKLS